MMGSFQRIAEHGIDLRLAAFAEDRTGEDTNKFRDKEAKRQIARTRLADLARRGSLPPSTMGRAAAAYRDRGDWAFDGLGGEPNQWLTDAGCAEDPGQLWRLAVGIDESGDARPGGLVAQLAAEGVRLELDRDRLTLRVELEPGGAGDVVELRPLEIMRTVTELRILVDLARLPRRYRLGAVTVCTSPARPHRAMRADPGLHRLLGLWRVLVELDATDGALALAGGGDAFAIAAGGRWWVRGAHTPLEQLRIVSATGGPSEPEPGSTPTPGDPSTAWRLDGLGLTSKVDEQGAGWVSTDGGGYEWPAAVALTWGICRNFAQLEAAQKVRSVRVVDPAGQLVAVCSRATITRSHIAGPPAGSGAVGTLARRVALALLGKVPGSISVDGRVVSWSRTGRIAEFTVSTTGDVDAVVRALLGKAIRDGHVERDEVDSDIRPPAVRTALDPVLLDGVETSGGDLDRFRLLLERVRTAYSADARGRLRPRSGHGKGRPRSGPTVDEVLICVRANPDAGQRKIARLLGVSNKAVIGRRLVQADEERRLITDALVSEGYDDERARALVDVQRATLLDALADARCA